MLLMFLVGVVVVAFLMVQNLTSLQKSSNTNTNNINGREQGTSDLAPIDAVKEAKDLIEQDNLRAIQQLK